MISPEVQAALQMILSDNAGENANGTKVVQAFPEKNKVLTLDLLKQEAERHPDRKQAAAGLHRLAINKIAGAAERLIEAAKTIPASKLLPTVPNNIAELAKSDPSLKVSAAAVLSELSHQETTRAGKAAKAALASLAKKES
jgi:hypothetical protein